MHVFPLLLIEVLVGFHCKLFFKSHPIGIRILNDVNGLVDEDVLVVISKDTLVKELVVVAVRVARHLNVGMAYEVVFVFLKLLFAFKTGS